MMNPLKLSVTATLQVKESLMRKTASVVLLTILVALAWAQATRAQTTEMSALVQGHRQTVRNWADDLATVNDQDEPGNPQTAPSLHPQWAYGGFLDAAYLLDFNHPANDLFRSRGTAYKVDEPILNMQAAYLLKNASESSRWGLELTLQGGQDTRSFGFSATAPNLPGSEWLRHLGPTDVSYLAPVGKGLTVQAGIFSSLIGYDSLYAKDNFSYTRPWGADLTPYLMMGVNVRYPFTNKLTAAAFVVNDYFHLADPNSVPSEGGQIAYLATSHTTIKETVLYGPHQSEIGVQYWRFLWDSIAEWKTDRVTTAFEYHLGTEKIATPGNPRALWMGAQLPVHWVFNKHWSATVRPEFYWDRDGRLTGFLQTVKANTTTLEYRIPYRQATAIVRLEHRIDDSSGPGGGFFRGGEIASGVVGLTPTQNLLILAVIVAFDSHFRP
ncbi:MAG: outer membrane beta-barrel protein [Candidatus Acidiferrum sp.]